jgi:hypothetical protein
MDHQETMEQNQPAAAVMHDLRRFLHGAHDQLNAIDAAAAAISVSAKLMQGHETELQKIHRALHRQIEQGVMVQVDGALEAHARTVTDATQKLNSLFGRALMRWQLMKFEVATLALVAGMFGAAAGVILTVQLLGRL